MSLLTDLPRLNAIRVGHLYHKPSVIHSVLAKSVRAVVHELVFDGGSSFSITGSCTLVSYEEQAFVVTTRHQLHVRSGENPPEGHFDTLRFATTVDGVLKNILVDRCFHEKANADQQYHDLLFFGVHQEWLLDSADRAYFLPLSPFSDDDRTISFFYGHPRSKNEVAHSPLHAYVRIAYIDGTLDREFRSHADYMRRYSYPKVDYEVNGFSGGAAFSLMGFLDSELWMALDGIIVMAGGGFLYIVDSDFLIRAISTFGA